MDYYIIWFLKFYLIFELIKNSESTYLKFWKPVFNFEDPLNWNLKRIPCENDRIILDENAFIYLNVSVKASEIILPKNGQIIFGNNVSIILSDKKKRQNNLCEGTDIKMLPQRASDWFDPFNWEPMAESGIIHNFQEEVAYTEGWSPAPHSEQVPCLDDAVMFNFNNSFKVNIDVGYDISIRLLQIWDTSYEDTESFMKLLTSNTGKLLFGKNQISNKFNIDFKAGKCNDQTGCLCGNDIPIILNKICSKVYEYGCPPIQCSDPIKQTGHCCDRCASLITFKYSDGFKVDLIQDLTESYLNKPKFKTAITHYHKTSEDEYELIIFDSNERGIANELAKTIKKTIDDDITNLGVYAIQSISLQSSTNWISESNYGVIWMMVILILIIAITATVAVAYIYKRRTFTAPFAFARFHGFDSDNRVELELGTTPHDALDPNETIAPSQQPVVLKDDKESINFENPIFSKYEENEATESVAQNVSEETATVSADNPLFTL